jgi:hypothetical protein
VSSANIPNEPDQLKSEIARTRADLGETVEALAAKTDITSRAKHAAGRAGDQAREKLDAAKDQAVKIAGTVKDSVTSTASSTKQSLTETDLTAAVRRPPTLAALGLAAALTVLLIYLVRRRRS